MLTLYLVGCVVAWLSAAWAISKDFKARGALEAEDLILAVLIGFASWIGVYIMYSAGVYEK